MNCECLPFTAIPHVSPLFRDYLYDFQKVQRFYAMDPRRRSGLTELAGRLRYDDQRRARVADTLHQQNLAFGASEKTLALIERLRHGALAVVTGQQVGLFGGPLYAVLKALAVIALAEELRQQGSDAVPVFWLATEDHDLEEVNYVTLLTPDGTLETLKTESRGAADAPVSEVLLGDDVCGLLGRVTALLGDNEITAALREAYRPGETLGTAFGRLFANLFGDRGLVLLDASDPALHEVAQPVYRAAALGAGDIDAALLERGRALTSSGYHEQVKVTPASTLLFEKRNGARLVVHRVDDGFEAGGEKFSAAELHERIAANPERFSANVLLRPVVQDFLLPTVAYVGGPSEIAYFAQAAVVYEEILGRVTPVLPRFSASLVDARAQRLLQKYGITLPDLFNGPEATRELLGTRHLPAELQQDFDHATSTVSEALTRVRQSLQKLDPTLVDASLRSEAKMLYQLSRLRKRAANAELRRNDELDRHALWLSNALYPGKGLQEREIAGVCFLARHGRELLDCLYPCAQSDCPGHQIVNL